MRIIPLPLQRQAAGRGAPGSRLYGHNRGGGGQIWYLLVVDMPSRPDLFPRHLRIGPYLRTVAANAKWRTADEFPSCQEWADEVEKVLAFLDSQDQFERFLPRLSARKGERGQWEERAKALDRYVERLSAERWEDPRNADRRRVYDC